MTVIVIVLAVALGFSFVLHFLNAKDPSPKKVASENRPAEAQTDRSASPDQPKSNAGKSRPAGSTSAHTPTCAEVSRASSRRTNSRRCSRMR